MKNNTEKTVAILQPGYLPWLGFFEQMARADLFIYFNNVQFTKKDWRNRNYILNAGKKCLLTVPVKKAPLGTPIHDIRVSYDVPWPRKHLKQIKAAYEKAPFFEPLFSDLSAIIESRPSFLEDLDIQLSGLIARHLNISTPSVLSSDLPDQSEDKNERIIDLCKQVGASQLYDGKAAADFIDIAAFEDNGVSVFFQDYNHPEYSQVGSDTFVPYLSAIDLIFNKGDKAFDILMSAPTTLPPRKDDA